MFEYATIIKIRAAQISQFGNTYAKSGTIYDTPVQLAIKEINEGKKPLTVLRQIKKNTYESY